MIDIKKAITQVINRFKADPLIIHSERDIQALLYNALLIQESKLHKTGYDLYDKFLKTNRVHCEYQGVGRGLKGTTRLIDIVVFSEDYIDQIKHANNLLYLNNEWGKVPCEALIEIKFENGSKAEPEKIKKDFKKLKISQEMHIKHNDIKPKLYFVYFFFSWNLTRREKMLALLEELPHLSQEGEKVNTYLVIGPRNIWEPIIGNLNMDIDKINLEYTI